MTENEKLRSLLAEARVLCDYNVDAQGRRELRVRIDAALAEPLKAEYSQDEVNEMTTDMIALRKEYEKNAYRRGAEAMREAAAQVAHNRAILPVDTATDAAWCRSAACIEGVIRAMPIPEDKP